MQTEYINKYWNLIVFRFSVTETRILSIESGYRYIRNQ